ncbi:hypothetical protein MTO96_004226 [Rhipicephalus appendiculatus]
MTGFRPRLSAQDSVLDLLSHIEHYRVSGLSTLAVFMDVAKAYDCVLQTGIANGLQAMGEFAWPPPELELLRRERKQLQGKEPEDVTAFLSDVYGPESARHAIELRIRDQASSPAWHSTEMNYDGKHSPQLYDEG